MRAASSRPETVLDLVRAIPEVRMARSSVPVRRISMLVLILVLVGLLVWRYSIDRNAAHGLAKPVVAGLAAVHPKTICENGDDGHGIDNQQPWFDGYYSVDLSADLDAIAVASAKKAGFTLSVDQAALDAYPYLHPDGSVSGGVNADDLHAGVPFSSRSTYLVDHTRDGSRLQVIIIRDGSVHLLCGPPSRYNRLTRPAAGKAIVLVSLTLPDPSVPRPSPSPSHSR